VTADVLLLGLAFGVVAKAAQLFINVRKGGGFNVRPKDRHGEDLLADELHAG